MQPTCIANDRVCMLSFDMRISELLKPLSYHNYDTNLQEIQTLRLGLQCQYLLRVVTDN